MIVFAFGVGLVLGLVCGAAAMLFAGFRGDPVEDDEPPTGIGA